MSLFSSGSWKKGRQRSCVPEAWELDVVALRLSFLSHQHPVQVPAAARAFAIMSDPHSPYLPHSDRLNGKLVSLWERKDGKAM